MTATSDRPVPVASPVPAQTPEPTQTQTPGPTQTREPTRLSPSGSGAAVTSRAPAGTHLAPNYHPIPVTIAEAAGAWVTDVEGRRYLDCLAAYSALNFGHAHPVLVEAARRQLDRVTLTSRAFLHDQLEAFAAGLAGLADRVSRSLGGPAMDLVLPMNTGAEAVETAIKMSRKWGYEVKGVPADRATIVVAEGNFHGRTTTIVSFSTDPLARDGFGPFTPGFRTVPYGDAAALDAAMDDTVVAVLIEPIQGEAGVIVPPVGYLAAVRAACDRHGALFVADEIQSGLGRVGTTFACELDGVAPDAFVLGKALGGGIVPVSAVVSRADVLGVLTAGTHGSTFGGNPLACAVGRAVVDLLQTGMYQERSRELGEVLHGRLRELLGHGVLAKDTHGSTIRLAPPLVIDEADLRWAVDQLAGALCDLRTR